MPSKPQKRRIRPGCDRLEARSLLSTIPPVVPGNLGYIRRSQFQAAPFGEVARQWRDVSVGGPVSIREVRPVGAGPGVDTPVGNTGNIIDSQFNARGFSQVGSQLRRARIDGAVVIDVYDEAPDDAGGGGFDPRGRGVDPALLALPTNSGDVEHSQFNDSGFGNIGLQWLGARVGGDLLVGVHQTYTNPAAPGGAAAVALSAGARAGAASERGPASTNTGLIRDSQFNDGGFGKVGLQFANVRVRGSVGTAMDSRLIESPQPSTEAGAVDVGALSDRPVRSADATNTGTIRRSQFNDGGFGDIGFQWSNVAVGRSVATSTNTLSIQPRSDGVGPITAADMVIGAGWPSPDASTLVGAGAAPVGGGSVAPLAATRPGRAGSSSREIDATNSGLIRDSQFNDGGFGDVGLQWTNVRVAGGVAAVHNSLSIQPENDGQGLITVRNIAFPSQPAALPSPRLGPGGRLDPTPPIIVEDGSQVTSPLPPRTRPYESFDRNFATNSGDVIDAQFNDGGFGDLGLQWRDVDVRGDVRIVHNSLSIHPEGNNLAGVSVSNVRFGGSATTSPAGDPILLYQRSSDSAQSDVYLQYDRASRGYGVVIVNNTLKVEPGANVTLDDVQFPQERRPGPAPLRGLAAVGQQYLDAATNSGVVKNRQFNDGGFGDVAMPWRKVRVDGPVTVVHNTLSVHVTGTNTGPIDVSNVVFDSGLSGVSRGGSTSTPSDGGGDAGHIMFRLRNARVRGPVTVVDNVLSVQAEGANTGPITISHVRYE